MHDKLADLLLELENFDFSTDTDPCEISSVLFDKSMFNPRLAGKLRVITNKKQFQFLDTLLSIFDTFPSCHEAVASIFDNYRPIESKPYFVLSADLSHLGFWSGQHGRVDNPSSIGTENENGQLLFSLVFPDGDKKCYHSQDQTLAFMRNNTIINPIIDRGYHNFIVPHLFGNVNILKKPE
jgi:hypothetical protein